MGEWRTGECGQARPFNVFWDLIWPIPASKSRPDPGKFAGKFYRGEEPENESDALIAERLAIFHEENANAVAECPIDNVSMTEAGCYHRNVRGTPWPVFSDYQRAELFPGKKGHCQTWFFQEQWMHCVGQLGEDHPTCKKARWYRDTNKGVLQKERYDEWMELGHFDGVMKWGTKSRRSFLPQYQNVKKNIPGAYEFFQSEMYLSKYSPDGKGEWIWPAVLAD
eukprot:TRINITY_DN18273_c0_g1_i1.p1 TRINITY_DN18273_c0_g1~~TRINITY_DN18273_c0_g1_i1.p1  ORF type:complete len:223 (+),score=40.17 TRINITY_DN18273_c0_g1_i1:321-989(+)